MTEIECRRCAFYFKRMENMDKGISVPVEGCVREIEDPDDCHEFEEKWVGERKYNEDLDNDDGFRDSVEEELMSIDDLADYDKGETERRLKALRDILRGMYRSARNGGKIPEDNDGHDDLMKEKF